MVGNEHSSSGQLAPAPPGMSSSPPAEFSVPATPGPTHDFPAAGSLHVTMEEKASVGG